MMKKLLFFLLIITFSFAQSHLYIGAGPNNTLFNFSTTVKLKDGTSDKISFGDGVPIKGFHITIGATGDDGKLYLRYAKTKEDASDYEIESVYFAYAKYLFNNKYFKPFVGFSASVNQFSGTVFRETKSGSYDDGTTLHIDVLNIYDKYTYFALASVDFIAGFDSFYKNIMFGVEYYYTALATLLPNGGVDRIVYSSERGEVIDTQTIDIDKIENVKNHQINFTISYLF